MHDDLSLVPGIGPVDALARLDFDLVELEWQRLITRAISLRVRLIMGPARRVPLNRHRACNLGRIELGHLGLLLFGILPLLDAGGLQIDSLSRHIVAKLFRVLAFFVTGLPWLLQS